MPGAALDRAADVCSWSVVWQCRDMLGHKSESVRVYVCCGEWQGGSLKNFRHDGKTALALSLRENARKPAKGCRAVAVASYRRGCQGEGPSLTIASSLARMVRGCGEGAAHASRRQDVAIRGAWRRPGRQERQAGGYGGGAVAIGDGAACRQDHERVKGKLLPVVVAVGSIAR